MAHFAELDENNVVLRVIVVANSVLDDGNGGEDEQLGIDFCKQMLGGRWVQTSYNHNMRGRFAGVGDSYHEGLDMFITPQPYPSWTLDDAGVWQPPVAMPDDGNDYLWDEDTTSWQMVETAPADPEV